MSKPPPPFLFPLPPPSPEPLVRAVYDHPTLELKLQRMVNYISNDVFKAKASFWAVKKNFLFMIM